MFHSRLPKASFRGGNLGGWGTVPPKFEVGDGPCIRPSNILRSSVVGCVRTYEKSKKGVFLVRKGLCTICNKVKIRKIREKRGKLRKTWSMTKKGHQKLLPLKGKFFQKKRHLGRRKIVPSPKLGARFPPLPRPIHTPSGHNVGLPRDLN